MFYAVIAAGGSGNRMGAEIPKQYLSVADKPIIAHTVGKFLDCDKFRKIIVLCPEEWCNFTNKLIWEHFNNDKIVVIKGGKERNETIINAIRYIEEIGELDKDTVIVTHDAVRPFVTQNIIKEHLVKSKIYDAIGTAIPATDTIIESFDGITVSCTPDRSKLYQCQTPQTFKALKLKNLYENLPPETRALLTDSCSIFTASDEKVFFIKGDVQNIKITYPHDLKVAEAILR